MKKIFLLSALILCTISCSDDITGLNDDTKNPTITKPEYLFTNAEKALVDQMTSTSVNNNVFRLFTQQWTETTYLDESQYDIVTRTIPDNHFRTLLRDVLRDLKQSKTLLNGTVALTPNDVNILNNKKAIIDILTAYSFSVLVDTFGNVPYSQSLDIEAYPLPKYDDAKTIYKDLISKLTTANATLITGYDSFGSADLIYGGDASNWKKFANSMRLKLAINMDDIDHTYATTEVLSAVTDGVILNSSENTNLQYLSTQPNTNPIYVDLVASGRFDFVPANTIVDKMNILNDPRRAKYFTFKPSTTIYIGGTYGLTSPYASYSRINPSISSPTAPGTLFSYTEVEFLLAEASARLIAVGGTIESHYTAAVTSSLADWNVSALDVSAYLAQPSVQYSTAVGGWKQKIGEQAWLALYNRGFESWTSYRRLDFPVLLVPATTYNNISSVPTRYSYPSGEQTLNKSNYTSAASAIGGDNLTTKIFWDKF